MQFKQDVSLCIIFIMILCIVDVTECKSTQLKIIYQFRAKLLVQVCIPDIDCDIFFNPCSSSSGWLSTDKQ